jgi:hypothetical protein
MSAEFARVDEPPMAPGNVGSEAGAKPGAGGGAAEGLVIAISLKPLKPDVWFDRANNWS